MTPHVDKIIRSKRKTLLLEINPDATVTLRVPLRVNKKQIAEFVKQQKAWIIKSQQELLKRSLYEKKQFISGEVFQFMGQDYFLNYGYCQKSALILRDNFYLATWAKPRAEACFVAWYKQQAKAYIPERLDHYAKQHELTFNNVKINSAKKRYGSCSEEGNLNFAWRLMMAPADVIDYVVVHELAHLVHHDHSRAFWQQVKIMMPDYKQHVTWLKQHGHLLDF